MQDGEEITLGFLLNIVEAECPFSIDPQAFSH
jgi:hypothetical protein